MAEADLLARDFAARHPDAFSRVLGRGEAGEIDEVLDALPAEQVAAIVSRLPARRVEEVFASARHNPARWLAAAPFDDAVQLLSRIPRERRLALVNSLADRDRRRRLLRHQQFPAHSVGSLVSDIPMRLDAAEMASDVLAELRELEADDPGPLVVVDDDGRYLGVLDRWRLLIRNPPPGLVADYLIDIKPLRPETPAATAATDDAWMSRNWLPVVDQQQHVLGSLHREKLMRAAGVNAAAHAVPGDTLLSLLDDLVHAAGAVLERLLAREITR